MSVLFATNDRGLAFSVAEAESVGGQWAAVYRHRDLFVVSDNGPPDASYVLVTTASDGAIIGPAVSS